MDSRELTRWERAAIRALVARECANYDREDGCIPLASNCYMFHKWWTGSYCLYFVRAVLPLDPALMAALLGRDHTAAISGRPSCPLIRRWKWPL